MKRVLLLFLMYCNIAYSMLPRYSRNYYWASKVPGQDKPYCERRKWRRMCKRKQEADAIKLQQIRLNQQIMLERAKVN